MTGSHLRDWISQDVITHFKSGLFWMKVTYHRSKPKQTRLELDNYIVTVFISYNSFAHFKKPRFQKTSDSVPVIRNINSPMANKYQILADDTLLEGEGVNKCGWVGLKREIALLDSILSLQLFYTNLDLNFQILKSECENFKYSSR